MVAEMGCMMRSKKVDCLVAEIGSTTTSMYAFDDLGSDKPVFLGQGVAPTTVLEGDVRVGLKNARDDLAQKLAVNQIEGAETLATSSAAGGLKMSVHGLVYDMTAKAAREAALGAGAIVKLVTAGRLRDNDIARLRDIHPNIFLLAGGVDHGERDTALVNAEMLAKLDWSIPLIYAGNVDNRDDIREIFQNTSFQLLFSENVYPKIDQLNVEPTRKLIQQTFEEHIVHAPGMEQIRDLIDGSIVPTPGAVMEAAQLLQADLGDLLVVDVGGATTDIHSVCKDSDDISRLQISPEPFAKRSVEGDLGIYVNIKNVVDLIGTGELCEHLEIDIEELEYLINNQPPIPVEPSQIHFAEELTRACLLQAIERHVGKIRNVYGLSGKQEFAEGKDLTGVNTIIGTGGALTRLPGRFELIAGITKNDPQSTRLLPDREVKILIDNDYILAALGVLSRNYPDAALTLAKRSLRVNSSGY